MKTTKLLIAIVAMFVLQSCCFLFKIGCDDCDDVQRGTELADLLLGDFESIIIPDEDETSTVYNIIHTIVNFANEIECPESVSDAGVHTDQLQLLYSENPDFTNPTIVETQNAQVNQSTGANENYNVVSEIQFETAGFYIIDNTIDSFNQVTERNENNNNEQNSLASRLEDQSFINRNVIHITEDMVSDKVVSGVNQPNYISKWEITVVQ